MPQIDTHSHWVPPSYRRHLLEGSHSADYRRACGALLAAVTRSDSPLCRLPLRLREMDDCGVDISVLSLPPPGVTMVDPDTAASLAREANDELLEAAAKSGGRFCAAISLPLQGTDVALAELARVAGNPGVRGASLLTVQEAGRLDDPRVLPVLERMSEQGLVALLHPATEPLPEAYDAWSLGASLAPMVSSTLGAARLVLSGALDRVPALEVVVPHLGGALPFLAQRFVDFGRGDAANDLLFYLRERLYLDTCSFHVPAFRCALETAGVERLVLGSDYPFRGRLERAVDDVLGVLRSRRERELVLGGTAARWFGPR